MTADDDLPQPRQRLRLALWAFAAFLLLLPAVAMQITGEVNWGPEDFFAAAVLLGGAGVGIELAVRLLRSPRWRLLAIVGVVALALLVWAELAVGILPG